MSVTTVEPERPATPPVPGGPRRVGAGLLDPKQLLKSTPDALRKLNPATLWRNPVMFIVEVGSIFTTVLAIADPTVFAWLITIWLWLTVIFANLAEAVAEGRGKAQAATLRRARTDTVARRLPSWPELTEEAVPAAQLRQGDVVVVEAGQVIPGDGDVIEGIASVDESAITGESAPVIRESGGDRSAVTGGTKVLSDRIVVRITQKPGESFIDRMIALVEGANRQKTPNEIALNILLAALTIVFLLAVKNLGEPEHALAREDARHVGERERRARRLEPARGNAGRRQREHVDRQPFAGVEEPVHALRPERVGELVRVAHDRRRPASDQQASQLADHQLG